jgi:hypothetical protein
MDEKNGGGGMKKIILAADGKTLSICSLVK